MEVNKMNYRKHIGDGKLPNHYWVFHYDEKLKRDEDELESDNENVEGGLLGEFKTYADALNCVDTKAYFPHITVEDRITGTVFESMFIVCPCCGKEDYETIEDIKFTKDFIENRGLNFK
jgi:hypothetical protein